MKLKDYIISPASGYKEESQTGIQGQEIFIKDHFVITFNVMRDGLDKTLYLINFDKQAIPIVFLKSFFR